MPDAQAEKLTAAIQRVDAMQVQLDRLASYLGSYATAASVLITILALIVTVALAVSTYFTFAVLRNNRLARSLRASIDELDRKQQDIETLYNSRIDQLEEKVGSYQLGLMNEVIARSGLMRELVAGELCYRRSDYDGAFVHFTRVHELDPENVEAAYLLGRTLTNQNKLDEAIMVYDKLLESDPSNVRASRGLALALRFRDPVRARKVASIALHQSGTPTDVRHDLHNEFALLLRDCGEYEEALRHHFSALNARPGDTATEYFIGIAEMLCHRTKRGRGRLIIAQERARIELEDKMLRPLWAAVIIWSAKFVQDEKDEEEERQLETIRENLDSSYLAQTVQTHLNALAEITKKPVTNLV